VKLLHQVGLESRRLVASAVAALVHELARMLASLQDVFAQIFLLKWNRIVSSVQCKGSGMGMRDTHRVVACIIAVWTFVDLAVLHLVHSHVSLQMAR
jgi:hypothetical protein